MHNKMQQEESKEINASQTTVRSFGVRMWYISCNVSKENGNKSLKSDKSIYDEWTTLNRTTARRLPSQLKMKRKAGIGFCSSINEPQGNYDELVATVVRGVERTIGKDKQFSFSRKTAHYRCETLFHYHQGITERKICWRDLASVLFRFTWLFKCLHCPEVILNSTGIALRTSFVDFLMTLHIQVKIVMFSNFSFLTQNRYWHNVISPFCIGILTRIYPWSWCCWWKTG